MSVIASLSVEAALRGPSISVHAHHLLSKLILSIPKTVEGVLAGHDDHPAEASGRHGSTGGTTHDPLAAGSYLSVIGTGNTALIHPTFGTTPEASLSGTRNQASLADRIEAAAIRAFESISGPERPVTGRLTSSTEEIFGSAHAEAARARVQEVQAVRTQQTVDGSTIIHFSTGHAQTSTELRVTFDDTHHHKS